MPFAGTVRTGPMKAPAPGSFEPGATFPGGPASASPAAGRSARTASSDSSATAIRIGRERGWDTARRYRFAQSNRRRPAWTSSRLQCTEVGGSIAAMARSTLAGRLGEAAAVAREAALRGAPVDEVIEERAGMRRRELL